MKIITRILLITVFLAVSTAFYSTGNFDVQGHRGCRGLMPENTLAAFSFAMELGVDTIELDTVVTRDGVVVINHDPYLNPERTRKDGQFISESVLIKNLTFEQLKGFDVGSIREPDKWPQQKQLDGERIPSLEEVLSLIKVHNNSHAKQIKVNIEIKHYPQRPEDTIDLTEHVRKVLEIVYEKGFERLCTIQSFNWEALKISKELQPSVETAALVSSTNLDKTVWTAGLRLKNFGFDIGKMLATTGCNIISPNYNLMSDGWVRSAHQSGMKIIPWTVNERDEMERLIGLGVDGIITDYPDRLLEVVSNQ